jgi:hypothetical protein
MMLYIRETRIDCDQNIRYGESDWYETAHSSLGELYRSLRKDFGKSTKMYRDLPDGTVTQIGWVFSKRYQYEDSPAKTYLGEVWVEVSTTEPRKVTRVENVTNPWKQ